MSQFPEGAVKGPTQRICTGRAVPTVNRCLHRNRMFRKEELKIHQDRQNIDRQCDFWIGLREHLQETMVVTKLLPFFIRGVLQKFL